MDEDLAICAVSKARDLGAEYTDARLEPHLNELVIIIDEKIDKAMVNQKLGIGIRVLYNGAWGFQSTTNLRKKDIDRAVGMAVKAARASSKHLLAPVRLAPARAYDASYSTAVRVDIEDVSLEEKLLDFRGWERALRVSPTIVRTFLNYTSLKVDKLFVNSEGAKIRFQKEGLWMDLRAYSQRGGVTELVDQTMGGCGGYEILREGGVEEVARQVGERADRLLEADPAKNEWNVTVVMDPCYMALLVHEIVGHPSEADRVLGREAAWAGTTWWAGKLGEKIGSDQLTAYDDPTLSGQLGYFLYDDEGVKVRTKTLIDHGILREHMHSRETALVFGVEPNAGMRALTYEYVPLIRMSCTYIAPGDWTYDEIIEETRNGYLVCSMREPSIDDKRLNWTISAQEAYKIEDGELTTHVRDLALTSSAPNFFKSVDAVSKSFEVHAISNCGKGDPYQLLYMGNGGPFVRGVANVVGVG